MSTNMIDTTRMSEETRHAWGLPSKRMYVTDAAFLFFRLRKRPDSPERFPKGKWASIQFFEGLIIEAATRIEDPDA